MSSGIYGPKTTANIGFLAFMFACCRSAYISRCYPLNTGGEVCFHRPNPPQNLSWSEAQRWCQRYKFTLPITDNSYRMTVFGNAVNFFDLRGRNLWLSANSTTDVMNWKWLNGKKFSGTVVGSGDIAKPYAYVIRNGSNINYVATAQNHIMNHICQYTINETVCASRDNSLWVNGKCYIKYYYYYYYYNPYHHWYDRRRPTGGWFTSLSLCGYDNNLNSYALAVMDNLDGTWKWLDDNKKFWIGLRSSWWNWQDAGFSFEITEHQFKRGKPSDSTDISQCLAFRTYDYDDYGDDEKNYWINLNCSTGLQFICQQNQVTTTRTSRTKISNNGDVQSIDGLYAMFSDLKMGVGLGVGLLLAAMVIWLAVITLIPLYMKRKSREPLDRFGYVSTAAKLKCAASSNRDGRMPPDSHAQERMYQSLHRDVTPKDVQELYENVNLNSKSA